MVFEFIRGGNLEQFMRRRVQPLPDRVLRTMFRQLLRATQYMHAHGYMHRDIKPENVLLASRSFDQGIQIKLADLGLAKRCSTIGARPPTTYVATRWYRSPEILLKMTNYSYSSDLWAIGVVMGEVVNLGKPLFPGENETDQLRRIVSLRGHPSLVEWTEGAEALQKRRVRLPKMAPSPMRKALPHASLAIVQLIEDLLHLDPARRPTASEALDYPLFREDLDDYPVQSRRKRQKVDDDERDTGRTKALPSSHESQHSRDSGVIDLCQNHLNQSRRQGGLLSVKRISLPPSASTPRASTGGRFFRSPGEYKWSVVGKKRPRDSKGARCQPAGKFNMRYLP